MQTVSSHLPLNLHFFGALGSKLLEGGGDQGQPDPWNFEEPGNLNPPLGL